MIFTSWKSSCLDPVSIVSLVGPYATWLAIAPHVAGRPVSVDHSCRGTAEKLKANLRNQKFGIVMWTSINSVNPCNVQLWNLSLTSHAKSNLDFTAVLDRLTFLGFHLYTKQLKQQLSHTAIFIYTVITCCDPIRPMILTCDTYPTEMFDIPSLH